MLTKTQAQRILASVDTLGNVLLAWRTMMGLSQTDAARRCGLSSPQHWWGLERDKYPNPELETLEKISAATGLDLDRLMVACAYTRKAKMQMGRGSPVPA
jgi:transcriptional regulator with XRE-family HTH domain